MLGLLIKVLKLSIPVPIVFFVALAIWIPLDKHSAVKRAIAELIASEQLKAKDAIIESKQVQVEYLQKANVRQAKLLQAIESANQEFKEQVAVVYKNNDDLKDKLNEIVSKTANNPSCDVVDDEFIKLLSEQ